MPRQEFSRKTQRQALARSDGQCEGLLITGNRCPCMLSLAKYHFDHNIPCEIGGDNSLENCRVLCVPCHTEKTAKRDQPLIAKARGVSDFHRGIKRRKGRPMPGSRASGLRKRMDGTVEFR